jgi:copper chaperone CopZ
MLPLYLIKIITMNKEFIVAVLCAVISFTASAQKKNLQTDTFKVLGTCEQCKNRIEKTLTTLGTYDADWVIETNMLTVSYDSTKLTTSKIQQKLASVGHDTEEFQAADNTYDNLPMCCHYDRYVKPVTSAPLDTPQGKQEDNESKLYTITGVVLEEDEKGNLSPLAYATVHCLDAFQMGCYDR